MRTSIWFRMFLNHPVYQFAMFIDTRMLCLFAHGGNLNGLDRWIVMGGILCVAQTVWAPWFYPCFYHGFTHCYILFTICFSCFTMFSNVFSVNYRCENVTVWSLHSAPLRLALPQHDEKVPGFRVPQDGPRKTSWESRVSSNFIFRGETTPSEQPIYKASFAGYNSIYV